MFFASLLAFLMAAVLTPLLAAWARRRNLLDIPNERSSHRMATPRVGGVAFVLAFVTALLLARFAAGEFSPVVWLVVGAACSLAVVGLVDDVRPLPALLRLMLQIGIASLVAASAGITEPSTALPLPVAIGIIALWITAATNAFNFMDGIDGIGAGQAIAAGLGWVLLGYVVGSNEVVLLGLLGAASPAGFLLHNWPPARVFMGDVGSAFLGFFLATLPLVTPHRRSALWICAALLIWPFLFDTGFTLVRRILRRENILNAHRSNLYQRLTATGLSHQRVSLLYIALALPGIASALPVAAGQPGALVISMIVVGVLAVGLWRYVLFREGRSRYEEGTSGLRDTIA